MSNSQSEGNVNSAMAPRPHLGNPERPIVYPSCTDIRMTRLDVPEPTTYLRFGDPSGALVCTRLSQLIGSAEFLDADVATVLQSSKTTEVYKSSTPATDVIRPIYSKGFKPFVRFSSLQRLWPLDYLETERRLQEDRDGYNTQSDEARADAQSVGSLASSAKCFIPAKAKSAKGWLPCLTKLESIRWSSKPKPFRIVVLNSMKAKAVKELHSV